jgi:tryptophan 2,3-dioxygenase
MTDSKSLTYWDYLKLDDLLGLQGGVENDEATLHPDESHFIIVHQIYELWFKLSLIQLRLARDQLAPVEVSEDAIPFVVHHLRRVNQIFEVAVDHFAVVETLTPQDFLGFRDRLIPASGFQSFQLREIEILLGLEDKDRVLLGQTSPMEHIRKLGANTSTGDRAWARIERARGEETLRQALHRWLYRTPIQGSSPDDANDAEMVDRFIEDYLAAHGKEQDHQKARMLAQLRMEPEAIEARYAAAADVAREFLYAEDQLEADRSRIKRIRAALLFIESYRDLPLLAWPRNLIDTIVELEEQMVLFRHRHARMVERTIGRRVGTGGSAGVDYLDRTTKYRIFVELWAVRTLLLRREARPALQNSSFYAFST